MKKITLLLFMLISVFGFIQPITSQTCVNNPSIQQGDINPSPLTGNTGVLQFSFFENLLDYTGWQTDPITITVCLLNISPQNGAASIGGSYASTFNWIYDPGSNCAQGTQNQNILGGSGGSITIDFQVTNPIQCPNNQIGFNANLQPAQCMNGINETVDDTESVYTCYSGPPANCSFGFVTQSIGSGLSIDFGVTTPPGSATYLWDFGDGNTSTSATPTHVYASVGTYNGSVTVDDGSGPCTENFVANPVDCFNNPSVSGGSISPTPLISNTGQLSFNYFEDLNDYDDHLNDPVTLTLCLLNIEPVSGASSIGGTYAGMFNWLYDPSSNCMQGTQNQLLPGNAGGTITVDFEITNPIGCPSNQMGYNVNVQPAACMAQTNSPLDDTESVYTCFDSTHNPNCVGNIQQTLAGSVFQFSLNGHPFPVQYYSWDFGDGNISGDPAPSHTYNYNGSYLVRLVVIDSTFSQCTYTQLVVYNGGSICIDYTLIDLSANCPGHAPVCGCDNVTYVNACIAENCFGVASTVAGPCATNTDSTCTTTASYQYTDIQGPTGHEVFFVANGTGLGNLNYFWDFGDGTTGTGISPTHLYSDTTSVDSVQAFIVCVAVEDSVQCVATYCETIVVVVNPNGNIAGGVYEDTNFGGTGSGGVTTGFNGGDPIPGVTVNLERADGTIISTDVTDALGLYSFDLLQFSDYRIRLDMPSITHDGQPITLDPVVQFNNGLHFQVDTDGNVSTSNEDLKWLNRFDLQPNPANQMVNVQLAAKHVEDDATLKIMNLAGQTVYTSPVQLNKNIQTIELELSGLVSGVYFVVMQSTKGVVTKKLVKH